MNWSYLLERLRPFFQFIHFHLQVFKKWVDDGTQLIYFTFRQEPEIKLQVNRLLFIIIFYLMNVKLGDRR